MPDQGSPEHVLRPAGRGVTLLAYADRLGGDLHALNALMDSAFSVFTGVHVLPFFTPFDGADAGFDPVDHTAVDPRLGSWADIAALAAGRQVTVDLIVNHTSALSVAFRDWLNLGSRSRYDGMFLTFDTVFPKGGTESVITQFYRPREGLPFTAYRMADGTRRLVWTTFMPSQVDLDVAHPTARDYLRTILATLAGAGVSTVRLDAVGYAVKTAGTDSFMTPQTLDFAREIVEMARTEGLQVLVEVHAHYSQQLAVAPLVDLVYDFALAPLLLHSLNTRTVDRLASWLQIRPENAVTVLDTHDGIGVIDAGPVARADGTVMDGLISQQEMADIFAQAARATDGHSTVASVTPAWAELPHQINATFFSVLGADPAAYLLARAVQLFLPGQPQIYYVGLLAGLDDRALFAATGNGRDVNRHVYTAAEIEAAMRSEVVVALFDLVRLRTDHPAFSGEFDYQVTGPADLSLGWQHGAHTVRLDVHLGAEPVQHSITASHYQRG